jgi:hypothetical protein
MRDISRKGMSMSDQLSMFGPPTLPDTVNAISLPASAAGPMRSLSPAGPVAEKSGPAPVPVSRFRAQDSGEAMPTSDTSGPLFTHSSPSAALQRSLESRLRARTDANGSPEYALTWRQQDMPAGPPICALRARARRTSGSGCSGWPTPTQQDQASSGIRDYPATTTHHAGTTLTDAARMAGWPTPHSVPGGSVGETLEKWSARRDQKEAVGIHLHQPLHIAAQMAGWPTPTSAEQNVASATRDDRDRPNGKCLSDVAFLAGWPTPTQRDHKDGASTLENTPVNALLGRQAQMAGWTTPRANKWGEPDSRGKTVFGSPASTEKRGALNPAFSLWLQGYPTEWACCGERVTRSSRRLPLNSSRHS